jgi:hypothetical protein
LVNAFEAASAPLPDNIFASIFATSTEKETFDGDGAVVLISLDFAFGAFVRFCFGWNIPLRELKAGILSFFSILLDCKVDHQGALDLRSGAGSGLNIN